MAGCWVWSREVVSTWHSLLTAPAFVHHSRRGQGSECSLCTLLVVTALLHAQLPLNLTAGKDKVVDMYTLP